MRYLFAGLLKAGLVLTLGNGFAGEGDALLGLSSNDDANGVAFEAVYTSEVFSNLSGGLKEDTEYLDNLDLVLNIDGEKVFGIPSATISLYVIANSGSDLSGNVVGDLQSVSNIDAPQAAKLYEAWWNQGFVNDALSLKFGLYDLNSEFDVIETAGRFINSSHGIGPDFSQSGQNGPSIFPTTGLALRILAELGEGYAMLAVLDGVPGHPDRSTGTHIRLDSDDGVLSVMEMGWLPDDASGVYSKMALGLWGYSKEFDEILNPGELSSSRGGYVLAERQLTQESSDPSQGLAVFGRYGVAGSEVNQLGSYLGLGVVYTGLFEGREGDQLGLAIAKANNGDEYRMAEQLAGTPVDDAETNVELTYSAQVNSWLRVQPDIQYVINPGTRKNFNNTTIIGVRLEIII
jgi:porin